MRRPTARKLVKILQDGRKPKQSYSEGRFISDVEIELVSQWAGPTLEIIYMRNNLQHEI
jgi:hypothetical protein